MRHEYHGVELQAGADRLVFLTDGLLRPGEKSAFSGQTWPLEATIWGLT